MENLPTGILQKNKWQLRDKYYESHTQLYNNYSFEGPSQTFLSFDVIMYNASYRQGSISQGEQQYQPYFLWIQLHPVIQKNMDNKE